MAKRLFVGNLSYNTAQDALEQAFGQVGPVASVTMVTDKYSGQSKGFAFVEMTTDADAQSAITTLNGTTLDGRQIVVNEARPREERTDRFSGGPGRGGNRDFDRRGGGGFSRSPRRR